MGNNIIKISSLVISNFFLIVLINRLFILVGIDLRILQFMSLTFLLGGLCCINRIKISGFDVVIIIYIFYMILNGLFIEYTFKGEFLYRALLSHVFPIMCYFIGRQNQIDVKCILNKMKWPLLFAMICGIVFFFFPPSWYFQMKELQLRDNSNEMGIAEVFRLSSFWPHPYELAYATLLYSLFITYRIILFIENRFQRLISYLILVICITVLFLSQLRVTILIYSLSVIYMSIYAQKEDVKNKIKNIIFISLFGLIFVTIFSQLASDNIDYITEHMLNMFEENSMSDRFEHTAGGINSYTFWGDGLGRYGYPAREHGKWAIVDHEYQCHLAELGYIGITILLFIILVSLLKCLRNIECVLENSLLAFFIIAMLGASVLSNSHQYNYIFWYTLGIVWSNNKKHTTKNENSTY